jgi:hypothetical protein
MTFKEVVVKVRSNVIVCGINSTLLCSDTLQIYAKDYFKRVCQGYISSRYLGDFRYVITYEV